MENLTLETSKFVRVKSMSTRNRLVQKQKQLLELLGYDVCISFLFNDKRNIAYKNAVASSNMKYKRKSISNAIFINKIQYSAFRELIGKKGIVENYSQDIFPPLLEGVNTEVYIPIFCCNDRDLSIELIGCLYLGSSDFKEFPFNHFIDDNLVEELMSDISKLLTLLLIRMEQFEDAVNIAEFILGLMDKKAPYLSNHAYNVSGWCREIGMELKLSKEELNELTLAGLLHDVGKIIVDNSILYKKGRLEKEEYQKVQEHVITSYKILKYLFEDIEEYKNVPEIVKYHHEWYDGKGYPFGLKGDDIPLKSYILGIADAVNAMLSVRPYRKNKSINAVIRELYKNRGSQFHPKLVSIVVEIFAKTSRQLTKDHFYTINLGSLIITQMEDVKIIEGNLSNRKDYFEFRPLDECFTEKIELSKVSSAELVIRNLNILNYYEVRLEDFVDRTFYISTIKPIQSPNSFNLLWDLDGILYLPGTKRAVPIEINKIGGDALSFSLEESYGKNLSNGKPLIIKVLFDELELDITGTVVRKYNFGPYKYFDFNYTNIPDWKRDAIFRQLFRKQIQLRKTISKYEKTAT